MHIVYILCYKTSPTQLTVEQKKKWFQMFRAYTYVLRYQYFFWKVENKTIVRQIYVLLLEMDMVLS